MKLLINIIVAFLLISTGLNAQKITIVNNTQNVMAVLLIPHGVMALSKKRKQKALKHRFAKIKPNKRVRLRADNLESIDIKVWNEEQNGVNWYKHDRIYANNLLREIKPDSKKVKIYIKGLGDEYKAKIDGNVFDGQIHRFSKIFRRSIVYDKLCYF